LYRRVHHDPKLVKIESQEDERCEARYVGRCVT
jgi:hypothetical protein